MSEFTKNMKLSNGLNVIFEKNDNANVISLYLGVRVGSSNEAHHESGICHLIEHMVFKGTKTYAAGEIATLVEAHGGELNAYTSLDQTVYYINLPSQHYKLGLNILKEMVFDAQFDAIELEREKEVVVEEIRRGKDSPHRVLGELLFSEFYKKHPYRRPVIGTEKLVRGFSQKKIKDFYKKHYVPQNMILGVCGNISQDDLSKVLEDSYRFETGRPPVSQRVPKEPVRKKPAIFTKGMDMQATFFDLAFPAPDIKHKDVPALDLLSHLLGESETSLLEQITKEKLGLVHHIYCSCYTPKHPGLFMIGGQVDPSKINACIASILEQISYVQNNHFEVEKIERAKLLARSQIIFQRQTCEGTVKKWITSETTAGDYNFEAKYLENLEKLTADDVMRVARKYLDIKQIFVAVLHPTKTKVKIKDSLFKQSTVKPKKHKRQSKFKDTEIYTLKNGLRVVLKPNHRLPIVSVKTASEGGLRYETENNNGIHQLISNLIVRSTQNYSQQALAEKCEWLATNLSSYTGRNSIGLSMTFLKEKTAQCLPLLGEVIKNPLWDKSEIDKEKALQLEAIKNMEDNPGQSVFRMVLKELYKNHPYSLNSLGTKKSVSALNAAKLSKHHNTIFNPKNMVISVVGDFETQHMLDLLHEEFDGLKGMAFKKKTLKKPTAPKNIKLLFQKQNKQQAHVAMGFLGTSIYDEDRFALEVINNVLSGQGGRLFLELRDKQSLAYTVTSTLIEGLETGFFGTYIGTEPSKVKTAVEGMKHQLKIMQDERISKVELERAKNYIIGNHEIDHQKNGSIAMQLALNVLYGQGVEEFYDFQKKISKVTAKSVQDAANRYIDLQRFILGVVGPEKYKS